MRSISFILKPENKAEPAHKLNNLVKRIIGKFDGIRFCIWEQVKFN